MEVFFWHPKTKKALTPVTSYSRESEDIGA